MKYSSLYILFALVLISSCGNKNQLNTDLLSNKGITWNIQELLAPPPFSWINKEDSIRSLLFRGEDFNGRQTKVFAYYGSPSTFHPEKEGEDYPGIVLVHGGGGTAFKWWVEKWVEKGYAAIAIDFGGNMPVENEGDVKKKALPEGGQAHNNQTAFHYIDSLISTHWQYHAVSAIIRSHSLLRSFEEVEKNKTAITGISWGGYLSCIVAGIDQRFKAVVPVYGSGFLSEGSFWVKRGIFDEMSTTQIQKWNDLWDPSAYVPYSNMPILFINSTNDRYYYLENFSKTAQLAPYGKIRIIKGMKHSHSHGAEPPEIFAFIEHYTQDGCSLPQITSVERKGNIVKSGFSSATGIRSAQIIFTTDTGVNEERVWETEYLRFFQDTLSATILPSYKAWYLEIIDNNGMGVTTALYQNEY